MAKDDKLKMGTSKLIRYPRVHIKFNVCERIVIYFPCGSVQSRLSIIIFRPPTYPGVGEDCGPVAVLVHLSYLVLVWVRSCVRRPAQKRCLFCLHVCFARSVLMKCSLKSIALAFTSCMVSCWSMVEKQLRTNRLDSPILGLVFINYSQVLF